MKILLLGSNGQLGKELVRQLSSTGKLYAFSRTALDITNYRLLRDTCNRIRPNVIVNAAAYTNVNQSEDNHHDAFTINADAVKNLAQITQSISAWLIHYSTDYVFDGLKQTPYTELDTTNPINVYGESKLAGENAIVLSECKHLIFRTSWVIGKDGHNFARAILRIASERNHIEAIKDQHGVPTSTSLISRVTIEAIQAIKKNQVWQQGVYHLSPHGSSTWHEIACTLISKAVQMNAPIYLTTDDIIAVSTSEYNSTIMRPLNSLLNTKKLQTKISFVLPDWKDDFLFVAENIIREVYFK